MNESEMTLAEQTLFKSYMRKNKKQLSSLIIDMRQQLKEKEEEKKELLQIWRAKYIELEEDYGKACDNEIEFKKEIDALKKDLMDMKEFIDGHPVNVVKLDDDFKTDIISKLGDELCNNNSDHIVDTIGDIVNENKKLKKQNQDLLNHSVAFDNSSLAEINKLLKINKRYKYKCEILDRIVKKNVITLLKDYDELVDVDPACEDCGEMWDDSDDEDLTL